MMQGGGMMMGGMGMGGVGMGGGGLGAGGIGGGHTGEQSRVWYQRDDLFSNDWKAVWQWEPKMVARWVGVIEGLEPYADNFIVGDIDGLKLLQMGTGMDGGFALMSVGITSMGARAKFMDEVNFISERTQRPASGRASHCSRGLPLCAEKYGVSKHMHRYVTGEDCHPSNIFTGIWEGLWGELRFGIMEGIAGIVFEPMKGACVDGADGCYEGCPIGLFGLISRPVMGVVECVRKISQGIKNTPLMLDEECRRTAAQVRFDYMKKKVQKERKEKANRRQRGKKDKPPKSMDDDYATNPFGGVAMGVRRFGMQLYLGGRDFVYCPLNGLKEAGGKGLAVGLLKGHLSLVCRSVSGAIDLVERSFEGIILCPAACCDSFQKVDDEYQGLKRSAWSTKAGTTQALVEDGEKQFWEKQKAVTQGADMQRGAMPAANFT